MKKTKRLLALVLAMMMAFSLLAMPAMAAGDDEGIMPLHPMIRCENCGEWTDAYQSESDPFPSTAQPHGKVEIEHVHFVTVHKEWYHCGACGHEGMRVWQTYVCYGGQ